MMQHLLQVMKTEHMKLNSLARDAATNINGGIAASVLSLPCGFRFKPTDEQLVLHYLTKKVTGQTVDDLNLIPEVKLYEKHPSRLTQEYEPLGESEWYFFTKRDKRCPNGERPNRGTGDGTGYWKLIDKGKAIPKDRAIGLKHTLDFIEGRGKTSCTRTKWKMHEYLLQPSHVNSLMINTGNNKTVENWVLCKLYLNKRASNSHHQDATRTISFTARDDDQMVSRPDGSFTIGDLQPSSDLKEEQTNDDAMLKLAQQTEEDDAMLRLAQQLEKELEQACDVDAMAQQIEEDDAMLRFAQQMEKELEQACDVDATA